jgi:hypothetical protein
MAKAKKLDIKPFLLLLAGAAIVFAAVLIFR